MPLDDASGGFVVFISYAHEDNESPDVSKRWLDRLLQHLQPLIPQDQIRPWSDTQLEAGELWDGSIKTQLQNAKAAVLLLSPAFLASKYIRNSELPVLLMNAKKEGRPVIPVVVRPCLMETKFKYPDPVHGPDELPLSVFQSANPPSKPLNAMQEHEQDTVLLSVARRILELARTKPVAGASTAGVPILAALQAAPVASDDTLTPDQPIPPKRTPGLFGREALIKDATAKLQQQPFLLVYGLRGNGKSALIDALDRAAPLAGKEPIRYVVTPSTTPDELFRQVATPLGETAEYPRCPAGDVRQIVEELRRRYPTPRPAWIWIDRAHHLLDDHGYLQPDIRNLLLGLQAVLGKQWNWVLEFRERPAPDLLGADAASVEVPGLDRGSLADCLIHGAPPGRDAEWRYSGNQLKSIYQWLGGGHGNQAHPLAIQLLIEIARGRNETPLDALSRHRGDFEQKIEERLLGDLYNNVLSDPERRMIQALALYRSAIPHDHADLLEHHLSIGGAWDGLDRRCLLSANADHSLYYLHSFIAGWLRTLLGYAGHGDYAEADLADITASPNRRLIRYLHSAVADCWLDQLGDARRVTNLNISRALEAFHHLVAAGQAGRVHRIAVQLLSGNSEWAFRRIERLYTNLYESNAPLAELRSALEYAEILRPDDSKVLRFLGECWVKEEGPASPKALRRFERACRVRRDYPPHWANLGRALLAQGIDGARSFLMQLESLERDYPEAINDYVRAIQSRCLELIGRNEQASVLRIREINVGSRNPVFYNDEARARLEAGDAAGALEMLDLAEQRGCTNDYTISVRASALDQVGQRGQAAALRMEQVNAGSRDPVFYADEARARREAGDAAGALEILDLAEQRGCTNEYTAAVRASVLRKHKTD